ncbi:MAG TPA: nucleotidyltransferase domain-containing protein [Polyangia bacterium]
MSRDRAVARAYAARLRARLGEEVVRVSLFGSRARGEARPDSDLDVLVVVRRHGCDLRHGVFAEATDIELESNLLLSPKVVTAADYARLHESGLPFWSNLARDEVEL